MRLALTLLIAVAVVGCADSDPVPLPADAPTTATVSTDADTVTAEMAASDALTVGDRAPDFVLPDAMGGEVRLSDLLDRGPVVLTFYRGAWCPYCNTQLRDYQEALGDLEATGATLVAVSPQTPDGSMTMQEKNELAYPVLSDVGNEVSREYGLVFQVDAETRERYKSVGIDLAAVNGTDAWELPVPATYVIAPDGVIRAAFVEADYTQRASTRDIIDALGSVS